MKSIYLSLILVVLCDHALLAQQTIEQRIDQLISKMTLTEKIGQTSQKGSSSRDKGLPEELKQAVRDGRVGSFLNVMNTDHVNELQRIALEESPNGIPIIFARDVIHGFKTIFPIPLGQAATWNPDIVEKGARIAAIEASTSGIRWTFAPMLDISRDARWGRIAESAGEDPYLTSQMAGAYIKGFQGNDLSNPTSIAACGKHFVGYGAAEGGRDYNTTVISKELLHNIYLKPFKAAKNAGIATYMTSFNEVNGVPSSGNSYILKDVLRNQWGFDGFVVSDWNSITEMIDHGYSENEKDAANAASNAGLDMEMKSLSYEKHLKELIEEGHLSIQQLDEMVRNILRIKFRLGLFDNVKFDTNKELLYHKDHLAAAKQAAIESMVLLKNNNLLPLPAKKKIALIGPLADAPLDQLGTWIFDGEADHTITPLNSLKAELGNNLLYAKGLNYSRDTSRKEFNEAIKIAKQADIIVFIGGEEAILSGEAHSRAHINLPGAQEDLLNKLSAVGKPIVTIIMAGRPITLENVLNESSAILFAWHPGTMGGPALADLLLGKVSPSGRLPVSWPKSVGQIPVYYNHKNTGRPVIPEKFTHINDIPIGAWQSSLGNTSHHLDDGYEPQFTFGYGLTYSTFTYTNLKQNNKTIKDNETVIVSVKISNTGLTKATETVQLYFQDKFASITRPTKELIGFQRITLSPNESKEVSFKIKKQDLQFYNQKGKWVTEKGSFNFWIGPNAAEGLQGQFEVK